MPGAEPEQLQTAASAAKANTSIVELETTALDELQQFRTTLASLLHCALRAVAGVKCANHITALSMRPR